jgi:hypothetical protein
MPEKCFRLAWQESHLAAWSERLQWKSNGGSAARNGAESFGQRSGFGFSTDPARPTAGEICAWAEFLATRGPDSRARNFCFLEEMDGVPARERALLKRPTKKSPCRLPLSQFCAFHR